MKDIGIIYIAYKTGDIQKENDFDIGLEIPISFLIDNYKLNSLLNVWVSKKKLPKTYNKEYFFSIAIELFPPFIKQWNDIDVFSPIDF